MLGDTPTKEARGLHPMHAIHTIVSELAMCIDEFRELLERTSKPASTTLRIFNISGDSASIGKHNKHSGDVQ